MTIKYCTPETNTILQVNYTSVKKKIQKQLVYVYKALSKHYPYNYWFQSISYQIRVCLLHLHIKQTEIKSQHLRQKSPLFHPLLFIYIAKVESMLNSEQFKDTEAHKRPTQCPWDPSALKIWELRGQSRGLTLLAQPWPCHPITYWPRRRREWGRVGRGNLAYRNPSQVVDQQKGGAASNRNSFLKVSVISMETNWELSFSREGGEMVRWPGRVKSKQYKNIKLGTSFSFTLQTHPWRKKRTASLNSDFDGK